MKKIKGLISVLLTFVLLFYSMPIAFAAGAFDNGTGVSGDPYVITTLSQLEAVSSYPSAYFSLEADIADTLSSSLGTFSGNFEGNGHTITVNLSSSTSVSDLTTNNLGLFNVNNGTIINVKVAGTIVDSSFNNYVGGVAGYNTGTITNCVSAAAVSTCDTSTSSTVVSEAYVGGVVGYNEGTVIGCSSSGNVSANGNAITDSYIGGLIGCNREGTVSNSSSSSAISTTYSAVDIYAGGLIGYNEGYGYGTYGSVSSCSASGTVNSSHAAWSLYRGGLIGYSTGANISGCSATGNVPANSATVTLDEGGLIGYVDGSGTTVSGCYATGTVTGGTLDSVLDEATGVGVGGLIGECYKTAVSDCYATGKVSSAASTLATQVGGLIGYNNAGSVAGCYALGDVTGSGSAAYIGGLVGNDYSESSNSSGTNVITTLASITNSHASGNVTSSLYGGGLVGVVTSSVSESLGAVKYGITNCYATGAVTATGSSASVGGLLGNIQVLSAHYCFSTGAVADKSGSNAGGIAGLSKLSSVLDSCYSTGNVCGTNITSGSSTNIGGLVGDLNSGTVQYSYATGNVTGTNASLGGLIGLNGGTATNCYWNTDAISSSAGAGTEIAGTGLSTLQMTGDSAASNMTYLDFTNTWTAKPNTSAGIYYPQLSVFSDSTDSTITAASLTSVTIPAVTSVAVNPSAALVNAGDTQTFTAVVSGGNSFIQTVSWSVSGNTSNDTQISSAGVLSVASDETAQSITVTAASKMDSTKSGSATIVVSATPAGSGILNDPYVIMTLGQLVAVNKYPSAYFKLGTDITDALPSPICSSSNPFTGNIDGNNHSITVNTADTSDTYVGLFAYIGSGGYIGNLTVTGTAAGNASTLYVGGLAGYNAGTIYGCTSSVVVTANGSTANYAGSLAGYNAGIISYSSANGDVTASGSAYVGGLAGYNYSVESGTVLSSTALIDHCNASGAVTANKAGSYLGGLVGINTAYPTTQLAAVTYTVKSSYATGDVIANADSVYMGGLAGKNDTVSVQGCYATGDVTQNSTTISEMGGLIGCLDGGAYVDGCNAGGSVTASNCSGASMFLGGLIGIMSQATVQNSYATANLSASTCSGGSTYVGGLIGYVYSCKVTTIIKNSYATGNVSATNVTNTACTYLGGLVGYMYNGKKNYGTLNYVYASGCASGANYKGGLIGSYSNGTFTACYWNSSKNSQFAGDKASFSGITGLTTAQMTGSAAETNMSGLNFSSSFTATENTSSKWYYPQLTAFSGSSDTAIQAASLASVTVVTPALSALAVSQGTISPDFSSNTTDYTAAVGNSVSSITLTPSTTVSGATITVNSTSVASGSESGTIDLSVGDNIITVTVLAADGGTYRTYTLTVTRTAAFVPVTDITGVPSTATAGTDLTLSGTVAPTNATNQAITWSVKDAGTTGTTISGNKLSTTASGTVTVTDHHGRHGFQYKLYA